MRTTLLKFVLLFSLVLLNTSLSTGQIQYNNIRFKQLSIAEGLPHNTINAITQDNHGFIWFGTRNGLCRYDGYNINLFAHNEADSTSLRHNFITRLYNDSLRNILWISTDQGICSYNYETEDFSRYQIKGNTKDDVCFLNTSDGMLLAACSNGLYRYNEQDSLFVPNYERDIYLQVKIEKGGIYHFYYSLDGKKYKAIGMPFTARQGKWIGAKVGLFSTTPYGKERGWVDADWFRIDK